MFHGIKFAICSGKICHILGYTHLPSVFSFLISQRLGKLFWLLLLWVTRWLGLEEWGGFSTSWGLVWCERRISGLAFLTTVSFA